MGDPRHVFEDKDMAGAVLYAKRIADDTADAYPVLVDTNGALVISGSIQVAASGTASTITNAASNPVPVTGNVNIATATLGTVTISGSVNIATATLGTVTITGTVTPSTTASTITNAVGNPVNVSLTSTIVTIATIPAGTNSIGQIQPSKYPTTDDAEYMNKYYTSAGAATDGIVWSPASGKRWYVTDLIISVSAATTVTLEDDKAGGDNAVLKVDLAANGGFCKRFRTPLASGEDAADLIVTTTAGNIYVTACGYEV